MKIDSGSIYMESTRNYQSVRTTAKRFEVAARNEEEEQTTDATTQNPYEEWEARYHALTDRVHVRSSEETAKNSIREWTIRYIFDLLFTGRSGSTQEALDGQTVQQSAPKLMPITYVEEATVMEREETSFDTSGTVRTSDGRELSFNIHVGMSREFTQTFRRSLQFAAGNMCDPLVINLDTDMAELSDQRFFFDLDADGELDEISNLQSGSGFLAIDEGDDGVVTDGRELFGTKSGDGFADLARFDLDGNGWIDENDPIWSKLRIWCPDAEGKGMLYSLAEKGVGAFCLGNVSTEFSLYEEASLRGMIRKSGMFLFENGRAGTLQHLDLAK